MTARLPLTAERAMSAWRSDVAIINRAMSGVVNLDALEQAEAALDRMASKAELRMAIRSAKAACRENARTAPKADDGFSIPAMTASA